MSNRLAKGLAAAACLSLAVTPALARDRGGWGGGWGGYRGGWGHHHDDGVDGGDILAGLLVIGAVAAIATAASKSEKDKDRPDDPRPNPDDRNGRYGQDNSGRDGPRDWGRSRSIDMAVDTCVDEVERGSSRVDQVDGVDRDGDGWRIMGRTRSGAPFRCSIDGEGRLRSMTVDGKAPFNG